MTTPTEARTRTLLTALPLAMALLLPSTRAHAQGAAPAPAAPAPAATAPATAPGTSNCPPGSWFCADAGTSGAAQPAAPAPAGKQLEPLPGTQPGATANGQTPAAPPVVVYQPAPAPVVVVAQPGKEPAPPPAYHYTPRKPPPRSEWGLNLHLEGAMLGKGYDGNAAMGGGGLGLRFRPAPIAAIEADLDFLGGRDYNGYRRGETALTVNCLLFLNPKSKVVQVYVLGGFGWAGAHAVDDTGRTTYDREFNYGYFGAQAGGGLEFRVARHFALNVDLRGFVRGRTDSDARYNPEFVSPDGRTTNTSGGGLLTGGATIYF